MNAADERLLAIAIDLAAAAAAQGELPYGSLLADPDGTILERAHNTVASSGDITAHPELKLARKAAATYPPRRCAAIVMYTSCEPCAMCAEVIARAGLRRVVFALSTEQLRALRPPALAPATAADVTFDGPALTDRATELIRGYYDRAR
ncbi:tRNA-specific adenosine deaminase [Actinoplanes lobatus]|uniref:tRNA(Arg) A34 adenosine deaminase TadA n=1 Tax=Actinoplanes lobatus TaxID=113568 RepID=A0A7W7HKU5_9ACTN|nr:nucleoside deaminase [Actinoplanes lobatus]MBB4752077.1 tRNA(Arg) A34 adenosine deaminase TadA [Actinoplanes lobatus]GGN98872.1 tRNA-specific adenosine deaminase [Actinoplanes lobatus]GIE46228.1 tRNA-specific adenosine deaminase [Actinoplanes lobatus]